MSENERFELEKHARLLDSWLHCGEVDKPRVSMVNAIQAAVNAMKAEQRRSRLSYKRHCAVLTYHIVHPDALLFRDPVTLEAIKTGIAVMERALIRQP